MSVIEFCGLQSSAYLHDDITSDTVTTFSEHTVDVAGTPFVINEYVGYSIEFTTGERDECNYIITSNTTNSITCANANFIGAKFPFTFSMGLSEIGTGDAFAINDCGMDWNVTAPPCIAEQVCPLCDVLCELTFYDISDTTTDKLVDNFAPLCYFPAKFGWVETVDVIDISAGPISDFPTGIVFDTIDGSFKDYEIPIDWYTFPIYFGYTDSPLWGPYTVSGTITPCAGDEIGNKTVRVENRRSGYYMDMICDGTGTYTADLTDICSIYRDMDTIRISTASDYEDFIMDYYDDPSPKTINLDYCGGTLTEVDVSNLLSCTIKRSISDRAGSAILRLENKNGRRSANYTPMQPITITVDDQTLFKGRVLDSKTDSHHILHVTAEDNSGLLHTNFMTDTEYVVTSIYDIITNTSTGIMPYYLPEVSLVHVPNNAATQQLVSITFEKESLADALLKLGNITSELGYQFYIDNDKFLRYEERRSVDSGITLENVGINRCINKWKWDDTARDVYNRVTVFGSEGLFPFEFPIKFGAPNTFPITFQVQFGDRITEVIEDTESQTAYGIRDAPFIDDENIASIAEARLIGDNILRLKKDPIKDIEISGCSTYKDHTFNYTFPISFKMRSGILDLQPGDLVKTDLTGTDLPQANLFPWQFTTNFTPIDKIIQGYEYTYPQNIVKLKLLEFYTDTEIMISRSRS